MRVLHVAACYPPTWAYGGIPRAVHALARAQARAGLDVRVWTTDAFDAGERAPAGAVVVDGVPVMVARNVSNRLAWSQQLYLPTSGPPSLAGVDLVHLHGHRHLLNARAFAAARRAGVPVVLTAHGTVPRIERKVGLKRAWDALIDGHVPREADAVVAASRAEVRQLLGHGVPADRIHRIPNALWLEEFDALPARGTARRQHDLGDGPLVVYLGQVTPRKRVDALVAAFDDPRLAGVTLAIAGPVRGMALPVGASPTNTAPSHRSWGGGGPAPLRNASPRVRTLGTLAGPDRLALLVDADVLAYPSGQEVFGLVPLEGLLCGAPVVVGDDCGCGEIVAEAGAGVCVDGSPAQIADALAAILGDPAAARARVARGQAWIRAHLAPEVVAAAYGRLYDEVRAGRAGTDGART